MSNSSSPPLVPTVTPSSSTKEMMMSATIPEAIAKEVSQPAIKYNKSKTPQFSAINWFLTYPRCEVSKEEVLSQIKKATRIQVKGCMIAQESHQDGAKHLHVALWLHKRATLNPSYFDYVVGKHGDYRRMKSGYATYNYLMKEDPTPISYGLIPVAGSDTAKAQIAAKAARMKSGDIQPTKSNLSITITQAIQSGSSAREVHDLAPGYFLQHKPKIEAYITWWQSQQANTKQLKWKELIYSGTDVNTKLIVDWLNLNIKKSRSFKQEQLYVSGPVNARKTSLLLKLLQYLTSYEIPTEDFYDLFPNPEPELIWMDEFKGAKTIQFLNLLAQGAPMTLRIKGAQRLKMSNPPLIVMSNLTIEQVYHKTFEKNPHLVQALQARFLEVILTDPVDLDNIQWSTELMTTKPDLIVIEDGETMSPILQTLPNTPPPSPVLRMSQVDLRSASACVPAPPREEVIALVDSDMQESFVESAGKIASLDQEALIMMDTGASTSSRESSTRTLPDDELICLPEVELAIQKAIEDEQYWATHRFEGEKKAVKATRKPRRKLAKVSTLRF